MLRHACGLQFISVIVLGFLAADSYGMTVTIVVNKGNFRTVEEAANSENKVNWWDDDLRDDAVCTESFAAAELAKFLPDCFAVQPREIAFADAAQLPAEGDVLLLGTRSSNPLIKKYFPTEPDLKTEESFAIKSVKRNGRVLSAIEGKSRVGVLYGAYTYLKHSGIRFYGLGEQGTSLPAAKARALDGGLDCLENPSFLTRGFMLESRKLSNRDLPLWMARNKLNFWTLHDNKNVHLGKKLGINLSKGGHEIMFLCLNPTAAYPYNHSKFGKDDGLPLDPYPVSREYKGDADSDGRLSYFEAHPEWYSLISGRRVAKMKGTGGGNNYCTSNGDATRELAKNLLGQVLDGEFKYTDVLSVWLLDNGKWCECENCVKQGSCTDKLLDLLTVVMNTLNNAKKQGVLRRNVKISSCAYHETLSPPTRKPSAQFDYDNFTITFFPIERCYVHPLGDSRCTEINAELKRDYLAWMEGDRRTYKGQCFIGEYYNVSSIMSLPAVFTKIMAADIPWYYQTGARHFCYMHSPAEKWGTWTLNQSLMAELLWNVGADTGKFLDEYFNTYYPTTRRNARKFYEKLEDASANIKPLKHYVVIGKRYSVRRTLENLGKNGPDSKKLFPLNHLKYDVSHEGVDGGPSVLDIMKSMDEAGNYLAAALKNCKNDREKQRLLEDARRIEYGAAMYKFYNCMIRTAVFHGRGDKNAAGLEFAKAEKFAKNLDDFKDLMLGGGNGAKKAGMDATQLPRSFDYFQKLYGGGKKE